MDILSLLFNIKLTIVIDLQYIHSSRINTMSFIEFESAREKERVRQELREVRAEILKRVN